MSIIERRGGGPMWECLYFFLPVQTGAWGHLLPHFLKPRRGQGLLHRAGILASTNFPKHRLKWPRRCRRRVSSGTAVSAFKCDKNCIKTTTKVYDTWRSFLWKESFTVLGPDLGTCPILRRSNFSRRPRLSFPEVG